MAEEWEEIKREELSMEEPGGYAAASMHKDRGSLDAVDDLANLVGRMQESGWFEDMGTAAAIGEVFEEVKTEGLSREEALDAIEELRVQFTAEGMKSSSPESSKLKQLSALVTKMDFQNAAKSARQLLSEMRPFNIALFMDLYAKTDQCSDALKGQYCWLFCGPTGAGKSTTIHYCAGSKMVRLEDSEHITFSEITNAALRSLPEDAIKPGERMTTSETRYIAAVPINIEDRAEVRHGEGNVMLTDSPGFCDSNGPEVDLANGLGMVKALKKAARVKVIIVMSKMHYTMRMQPVKTLTSSLFEVLPNYEDILRKHSLLCFTKASEDYTVEKVRRDFAKAVDERKNVVRDSPECFEIFAQCLKSGKLPAYCVFPLDSDRHGELIDEVCKVEWIRSPARQFKEFVSSETKVHLKSQFLKYRSSIRHRCDMGLNIGRCAMISKYFTLMRYMTEKLPSNETLKKILEDCESIAKNSWNAAISSAKEAMDNHDKVTVEGFLASLDEFTEKCSRLNGAELAGLMDEVNPLNTVDLYINGCVEKLINHLTKSKSDDPWQDTAAKLRVLVDRYSATNQFIQEKITAALQSWNSRMEQANKQAQSCIVNAQWSDLLSEMDVMGYFTAISNIIEGDDEKASEPWQSSRLLRRDLKKHLYQLVSEACRNLDFSVRCIDEIESVGSSHGSEISLFSDALLPMAVGSLGVFDKQIVAAQLGSCNDTLESCVDALQRSAKISPDYGLTAQNVQRFFWDELVRFCTEYLMSPAESLLQSETNGWVRCNEFIDRCQVIRKVSVRIQSKTSDRFFRLRSTFQSKMEDVLREAKEMIDACNRVEESMDEEEFQLDYRRLVECVGSLTNAGLPDSDPRMTTLSKKIGDFVESLGKRAERIHLTIERNELLSEVKHLMYQLSQLSQLQKTMPDLQKQCDELFARLKQMLVKNFSMIALKFDVESRALEHLIIERAALKELCENFKVFENTVSKSQFTMVYRCASSDLTKELITSMVLKLESLAEEREKWVTKKTEREGRVGQELEKTQKLKKTLMSMLELEEDCAPLLARRGFKSMGDVAKKVKDLTKRLQNLCPDLIKEIERVDMEMQSINEDKQVITDYIRSESAILDKYEEIPDRSEWWVVFRTNKIKAKERLIDLDHRLITGDKYDFEQLDLFLSMHSLLFIEQARMINLRVDITGEIATHLETAERNLKKYLITYGEHWNTKFTREFDACMNLNAEECKTPDHEITGDPSLMEAVVSSDSMINEESNLSVRVELLNNDLRELQKICEFEVRDGDGTKGRLCGAIFNSPSKRKIGEIYDKLCSVHTSLGSKLVTGTATMKRDIADLCFELSIVDDSFIRYAVRVTGYPEKKFTDIQTEIHSATNTEISELRSGIIPAFNEGLLTELETRLVSLEELGRTGHSRVYKVVCSSVSQKLSELYTDAFGMALQVNESMSEKDMLDLNEKLRKLQSLTRVCRPHFPSHMQRTIEEKAIHLKSQLASRMQHVVDSVKTAAENNSFNVAERRLKTAQTFNQYLNGAVGAMLDKQTKDEITDQLKYAREKINESMFHLEENFEKIDLVKQSTNPFSRLRPRHVYDEMKVIWEEVPAYRSCWNRIEEAISVKFIEACDKVKGEEKKSDEDLIDCDISATSSVSLILNYAQRRTLLRRLETYLRWLPEEVSAQLQSDIDSAKEEFEVSSKEHETTVTDALKNADWGTVAINLDAMDSASPTLKSNTLSKLTKTVSALKKDLMDCLSDDSKIDRDSLTQCKEILQRMNSFSVSLLGPVSVNFSGKETAKNQLQNAVDRLINVFSVQCEMVGDTIPLLSIENIQMIDGKLQFLAGLLRYLNTAELCSTLYSDEQREIVKRDSDKLVSKLNDLSGKLIAQKQQATVDLDMDGFGQLLDELYLFTKDSNLLMTIQEFRGLKVTPPSYEDTVTEVKKIVVDHKDKIVKEGLDNEKTRDSEEQRRSHFSLIRTIIDWFSGAKRWIKRHLGLDSQTNLLEPCMKKIRDDSQRLVLSAKKVIDEPGLNFDNLNELNTSMEILECCEEFIPKELFDNESEIDECKTKTFDRILVTKQAAIQDGVSLEGAASKLIELQKIKDFVGFAQKSADDAVTEAINSIKAKKPRRIHALGPKLQEIDADRGASLINEQPAFAAALIQMQARRMVEMNIDHVLKDLKGFHAQFDRERLRSNYERASEVYFEAQRKYLAVDEFNEIDFEGLVERIMEVEKRASLRNTDGKWSLWKSIKSGMKRGGDTVHYWTQEMIENTPELVGLVFALWTLKNSKSYFDTDMKDDEVSTKPETFLLQPRVAQYVSVFCLLGLDEKEDARPEGILVNNLVEIGTGEGKSVTLAVTSAVLALLGFDVSCGCFSELLSNRDYENFIDIFDTLNVSPYIHYGTFNGLFERILNNRMNLRRSVEDMLSDKNLFNEADDVKGDGDSGEDQKEQRPTILLIDEVDVFFQKDFFGALYSVSTIHKNAAFADLIRWVWERKKSSDESRPFVWNEEEFLRSAAFEAVKKEFVAEWHPLLEEAMKDIFDAAKTSEDDQSYVVCDGRIGYKFQDSVSFKAFKGYKTMFAYLKEYDEGRVSEDALNRNLGFFVKIASFSYAEVPQTFSAILGVTGTLQTLSEKEKIIMERDYGIMKHVYNPSLFGANHLIFCKNRDTECVKASNYQLQLTEAIKRARNASAHIERPVLVIFEDKQRLQHFEKCLQFTNYLLTIGEKFKLKLTEDLNNREKTMRIKQAVSPGMVTLATASFGRGIDFQVYNDTIDANGGMHVECAFLSESFSEEVQFRGRTARQGRQGSFHMIVDIDNCLAKFGVSLTDVKDIEEGRIRTGIYDFIDRKRNDRFAAAYEEMASVVKNMRPIHEEAEEFVAAMECRDWRKAAQMLIARNEGAFLGNTARMCIVIDATASMGVLLNQVKNVLQKVIPQLQKFLQENGKDKNMFQIQITCYRNYNAPAEELVIASDYTSDVNELIEFLTPIYAGYGWGPEATEVGLAHVAGLSELPQFVLLIGDAPSNENLEMVKFKRKNEYSEQYWSKFPRFATPTVWNEQVKILKDKGVRINTFYLDTSAQANFEEIAKLTNGVSKSLNVIIAEDSIKLLSGAVADQVLHAIAGGSKVLMDAYRKSHSDLPSFL